ncbi:ATP-dependent DNA helicase UvrD2 [Kineococcus rubinsiae]|uniref:ATP-dependent DNA helicase UvrD2 n=1 Tax=Kineococcus rubinsiae TaxID=2609562 RepID=UPI00143036D3|nr:ATP-dependent DNA helicase UvrD2 [Kineococcus rubinsiae]NIZ91477.1 ATP-dependent DNA helicase UvrD2 [Kineococcus rubinsiae]
MTAAPLTAPSADSVLAGLDPEQRQVATTLDGPVCVLAGAGTGKTRAITHRIAYGVHSGAYVPNRVLAVTFTARAAGEMRTRLRDLGVAGVQARTFHAAALRQLQFFWPQAVGGSLPHLAEHKAPLVADACNRLRLSADRARVRDLSAEVEWAKVMLVDVDDYVRVAAKAGRGDPGGLDLATVARLIRTYEDVKTDRGVIDFEDVLLLTAGILDERPDVAATVREQYRHFVVDEYQDVSPLQQRLLDLWRGDRQDLCVVGDASQTIYSFAGATPEHLLEFPQRHPGTTVVRLVRDYRSTPEVVGFANAVLSQATGKHARARLELIAQRPSGPAPTFTAYDDDVAEASGVAARIAAEVRAGRSAKDVAVLFRTNGQSQAMEAALADAGVGYVVRGGERFFSRREVRDAIVLLRGAARSALPGAELGGEVRAVLSSAGWTEKSPTAAGQVRERWESLQALVVLADELADKRPDAGLPELVAELEERASAQHAPTVDGVTLASLHAAKGLEWDVVHLIGVCEGLLPISFAETPDDVEEERRLLYVGVTRAREGLHVSWANARTPGGRASRKPSRFLDTVRPQAAGAGGAGRQRPSGGARKASAGPAKCRTCGNLLAAGAERKLGRCSTCPSTFDEAVFDRLREWRSGVAREDSVPAYVVFTDATLTAIAETMPTDVDALAKISGVGPTKLEKWGQDVLALLTSA